MHCVSLGKSGLTWHLRCQSCHFWQIRSLDQWFVAYFWKLGIRFLRLKGLIRLTFLFISPSFFLFTFTLSTVSLANSGQNLVESDLFVKLEMTIWPCLFFQLNLFELFSNFRKLFNFFRHCHDATRSTCCKTSILLLGFNLLFIGVNLLLWVL